MRSLIREPLLERRCLAGLHRIVKISLFHFLQFNCYLSNLTGELERYLISLGDGRAFIRTHVGTFVSREGTALGTFDPTRGNACSIDEERANPTLADTTAVVSE